MIRAVFPVFALTVCLSVQPGAQQPAFRGSVDSVSVFATVVDANQRLVTGLEADDFEIYDNGVRQRVEAFSRDPQPFTMVMMLDQSGSMSAHFGRVRAAADVFVNHLMPGDRLRIGTFANSIQIDPTAFSSDQEELRGLLRGDVQRLGESPVWNATSAAMNALASQTGRRVVFLFTDGHDSTNTTRPVRFDELRSRVADEDVLIYAIGFAERCATEARLAPRFQRGGPGGGGRPPGGRGPRPPSGGPSGGRWPPVPQFPPRGPAIPAPFPGIPPRTPDPFEARGFRCKDIKPNPELRELTEAGGGGYFELDLIANLDQTFARVADELHQQYLLAFTPPVFDNTTHRLEVRVRGSGRTVRARKTYFAGR